MTTLNTSARSMRRSKRAGDVVEKEKVKIPKKRVLALLVVGLMIGFGALILAHTTKAPEQRTLEVCWIGYPNLMNMTKSVDLVVIGFVFTPVSVSTGDIPVTTSEVQVLQVIKPSTFNAKTVSVEQLGAATININITVKDNPLLKVGDKVILFLIQGRDDKGNALPSYGIAGGPQGQFIVDGDKVYSTDAYYHQTNISLSTRAEGEPLTNFVSKIQSYLKVP